MVSSMDGALRGRLYGKYSKQWHSFLADCIAQLRGQRSKRRHSARITQQAEVCEARMLLSGMSPTAGFDMYNFSKDSTTVAASGVLVNDSDMESDPLTAVLYSGVSNGTLTLNSNGGFTYGPTARYAGSDGFSIRRMMERHTAAPRRSC
ncbi:MAG: Ig-like domain-containing protein [Planctomycetaceae bacterium]